MFDLALNYNGVGRVTGNEGNTMGGGTRPSESGDSPHRLTPPQTSGSTQSTSGQPGQPPSGGFGGGQPGGNGGSGMFRCGCRGSVAPLRQRACLPVELALPAGGVRTGSGSARA